MGLSRRDSEQSMGEYHGGVLAAPCSGGQLLGMVELFACYLDAFHEGKKTWLKLLRCIGIDVVSYHPEYLLASHDAENANMSLLNQVAWSSSLFSVPVFVKRQMRRASWWRSNSHWTVAWKKKK